MKNCTKCKLLQNFSQFRIRKTKKLSYFSHCKTCEKNRKKENRKDPEFRRRENESNSVRMKERGPGYRLKTRYGITIKQKQTMFNDQNAKCFCCPYIFKSLEDAHTDHNHSTGKVRKLLCGGCNTALGMIKENFDTALNIAKYIQEDQGVI